MLSWEGRFLSDSWRLFLEPYNLVKVIAKIVDHAWNELDKNTGLLKHRQEFLDKGIRTQAHLREIVSKGVEHKNTRAFHSQPSVEMGKNIGRDLYGIPLVDPNGKPYELVVIVNPGLKDQRLLGGTCFIPLTPDYFDKELNREVQRLQTEVTRTVKPQEILTIGGRPALREQDSRRQVVEYKPPPDYLDDIRRQQQEQFRKTLTQEPPKLGRSRELDDDFELY